MCIIENPKLEASERTESVQDILRDLLLAENLKYRKVKSLEKVLGTEDSDLSEELTRLFNGKIIEKIKHMHTLLHRKNVPKIIILTKGELNLSQIGRKAKLPESSPHRQVKKIFEKWEKDVGDLFQPIQSEQTGPQVYDINYENYPELTKELRFVSLSLIKKSGKKAIENEVGEDILYENN